MANQTPKDRRQEGHVRQDPLNQLMMEVQKERKRIQSMKDPSLSSLKAEVGGTNLDLLEDALKHVLGVRNHLLAVQSWASGEFQRLSESEDLQNERINLLETYGGDTQILPDHAQVFLDVIEGCMFVAQKLIQGPFPINYPEPDAMKALSQLQEKCASAKLIVEGAVLEADSYDEDEGGDEADEEQDKSDIVMPAISQGTN
jgi:hypothetical protein